MIRLDNYAGRSWVLHNTNFGKDEVVTSLSEIKLPYGLEAIETDSQGRLVVSQNGHRAAIAPGAVGLVWVQV